jgi:hypothetical protein
MEIAHVMIAYAVLALIVPKILTKPTKIDLIDNTVIYLDLTRSYILNATLFVGLVMWIVHKYGPVPSLAGLE